MTEQSQTRQAERSIIFGLPNSGKTERARTMGRAFPRVLYYDSTGHDYTDGVVVESLDELKRLWRRWYRYRAFRLIYRPRGSSRDECRKAGRIDPEFATVCSMAYDCGEMLFVVDEADLYFKDNECDREFLDIIKRGRHADVELIAVTQVPQGLGRHLTGLPGNWYIFQTAEPAHIRYFANRCYGIEESDIRSLAQYEYIYYRQGDGSYWICRDDLTTGKTERMEREYRYDRPLPRATDSSGNVRPVETVGDDATDGPENLSPARPA